MLDGAVAGRGSLVLLRGEPGIGKSRLADEDQPRTGTQRGRPRRALLGGGQRPGLWPWGQALRGYVRDAETASLEGQLAGVAAGVVQLVPELRERFPALPEPTPVESDGARFRLFDATAEFLRNAAEHRPLVLVLDDLHAADEPSLLLLRFVARELGSMRMLVIGAYRDVDPPGPQLTELVRASPRACDRRLSLTGLSKQEVAAYVERAAAGVASSGADRRGPRRDRGEPAVRRGDRAAPCRGGSHGWHA